jgi:phosphoribosyl 1,2-cyclic phosphate phosphodiesterase
MKITFLGTGTSTGIPYIGCDCEVCLSTDSKDKRLRTSIHIEIEGKSIVIDTGADFRQQMLRENIRQLDAILFTHQHKDHTAGLDDIRVYNSLLKKDIPIYARFEVIEQLKREFAYAFAEQKYPGIPSMVTNYIDNQEFDIDGIKILPIEVMHYKLPVFGFRIADFTYITDANYIAPEELEKIKGSKVVVLNALHREKHISHYNLSEALAVLAEIGAEQSYIIHMSHNMGKHADVSKELPHNVALTYDGLQLVL